MTKAKEKSASAKSAPRKVTPAPEGQAGFCVEGFPYTYDEATAERLSRLKLDGSGEPEADETE